MNWRQKKNVASQKVYCKDKLHWVQMEELEDCIDHIVFTKLPKNLELSGF